VKVNPFPLMWPEKFPRREPHRRDKGTFKTTLPNAIANVQNSLKLFASDSGKKLEDLSITSNYTLGVHNPDDPGVAVWFVWDGMQVSIAVDRYTRIEANLQAIHHIIEARRVELRHGTLALVRATLTGFIALPAPAGQQPKRTWREVMNFTSEPVSLDLLEQRYRLLASKRHPDKGGSNEAFAELGEAYAQAKKEVQ
jgi:hypothetical protein